MNNIYNINNNIDSYNQNSINTISAYISQAFNNFNYNQILNLYLELLKSILHTILIHSNDKLKDIITNLINNETNIHNIIIYSIQILKENQFSVETYSEINSKSIINNINNLSNSQDILTFIKKMNKWLYINCNFKHFLTKIIELNLNEILQNSFLYDNWNFIYTDIINNHFNNNNLLINSIWYQQLRLIHHLYLIINENANKEKEFKKILDNINNTFENQIQNSNQILKEQEQHFYTMLQNQEEKIKNILITPVEKLTSEQLEKYKQEMEKQQEIIFNLNQEILSLKIK